MLGRCHATVAVHDLNKDITKCPNDDFSVPLIAVLLSLGDKDVVQAVVSSPSLLARLVQYTSKNMRARSVTVCYVCETFT